MKEKPVKGYDLNSTNLILYLYSRREPLLLISAIGFILSVIASLLITPKFNSTVVMFPASSASVSQALVSTTGGIAKNGILTFGEEEQTEQLLQILNSDEIKEKLTRKFHLFEHYRIDTTAKFKYTQLYGRLKKNISFKKTQYMSVKISVLDEDPRTAADMANEIASLLDSTINRMQKKRAVDAFQIVSVEYNRLREEITELEDSLKAIGQKGVYDVESQSRGLNEAWLNALTSGNQVLAKKLENQIKVLGEYGGAYIFIKEFLQNESARLSLLKDKYTQAKVDMQQNLPHSFIVSKARKAEKKAYPKRSYIVLAATFSSFLFAFFLLVILDSLKKDDV